MVAPPNFKHYPRSVSWQVASVLNPSLQNCLPIDYLSSHSREKREREGGSADKTGPQPEEKPHSPITAFKSWQEDSEESGHKLTLPPQYVSPGELCKAMPKYMRLQTRPKTNGNGKPVPFSTATDPVNPFSPRLSPRYDLAAGSPRSHGSSGRETPRSVVDSPKDNSASKTTERAKTASNLASPASPARSLKPTPPLSTKSSGETTPPASTGYQNTPLTSSELQHQKANPSGAPSPRRRIGFSGCTIRSAATSPMSPVPSAGSKVTDATPTNATASASATLLRSKLNTLAQYPELAPRVQMASTAVGSPLSPTLSTLEAAQQQRRLATPPVALPPTPPVGSKPGSSRQRRIRPPHPPEPTLETYKKASPNTYATNTVWNDRRDTSRHHTISGQSILIKSRRPSPTTHCKEAL